MAARLQCSKLGRRLQRSCDALLLHTYPVAKAHYHLCAPPPLLFLLLWLSSFHYGFLVVPEKPNRNSFTFTFPPAGDEVGVDCGGRHCHPCSATKPLLSHSAIVAIGVVGGAVVLATAVSVYVVWFTWVGIQFGLRRPRPGEDDRRRDAGKGQGVCVCVLRGQTLAAPTVVLALSFVLRPVTMLASRMVVAGAPYFLLLLLSFPLVAVQISQSGSVRSGGSHLAAGAWTLMTTSECLHTYYLLCLFLCVVMSP
jgi:hypothetical protein